jgi:hypothetical protein
MDRHALQLRQPHYWVRSDPPSGVQWLGGRQRSFRRSAFSGVVDRNISTAPTPTTPTTIPRGLGRCKAPCILHLHKAQLDLRCGLQDEGGQFRSCEDHRGRNDRARRSDPSNARQRGGEGRFPHDNDATLQHFAGCTVAAYATAKHLGVEALSSFGISESYYLSKPAGCWLLQSGQIGVGHGLKAEIPRVHPVTDTIGDNNVAQNPEGLHVSLRLL